MNHTIQHLEKLFLSKLSIDEEFVHGILLSLSMDGFSCANNFPKTPYLISDQLYGGDSPLRTHHLRGLSSDAEEPGSSSFNFSVGMVCLCLCCAGLASGLTQGLLSLDHMEMEIKSRSGTDKEKAQAAKVLPIISRHHLLLVTLMLWNASAMEALPIFLDSLVPSWLAIVMSVTLILFVGEIIPAAILTGPRQLEIASALTPLVYCVLVIFYVVAYPISVVLDYVLGHDE
jgi:hypothetical protein